MSKYNFSEFKNDINKYLTNNEEPEATLIINGKNYMIIAYKNKCSFQRCGYKTGSGEYFYENLDVLYSSKTVDDIVLEQIWDRIEEISIE